MIDTDPRGGLIPIALITAVAAAIGAQISFGAELSHLTGDSLMPITLESLVAIMAGFAANRGAPGMLGVGIYILAAALWAPILPHAGTLGGLRIDAGFLVGLFLAPQLGWSIAEWFRETPRLMGTFIGALAAHGIILVLGVAWLALYAGIGSQLAIDMTLLPAIPGVLIKSGIIAVLVTALEAFLSGQRQAPTHATDSRWPGRRG